jgi:hypothetical protein
MSSATYIQPTNHGFRHYLTDVSNAARAFAAALFAAQERQFIAQEVTVKPTLSERARLRSHRKLIVMANAYQHMHPSLAAELRNLASRG